MTPDSRSIPFMDLPAQIARLRPRVEARLRVVLDHGQFILGPEVEELEAKLAAFSGAAHAIGVASGTDALIVALMGEGMGPGDAVFVPSFTFIATAGAVIAVGATPVFCDVDSKTFNLDAADLERRVQQVLAAGTLRPRGAIPVDLFGLPADYPALREVATEFGLFLLADAAQSFGAGLGGVRVGRLAPVTATSFFPSKPLGAYGDGGAIFTDDPERAARLRAIRVHGQNAAGECERPGLTSRLDSLQAAVLLAKLDVFEAEQARREAIAQHYDRGLAGSRVSIPARSPPSGATRSWSVYSILCEEREALRGALRAEGIATRVYYETPLHLHPALRRYGGGHDSLPVSEWLSERILSLPIYPDLDEEALHRIVQVVHSTKMTLNSAPAGKRLS